ncbi:MAG: zeta toxin family protein [Parcubacteria group bacterium]|nr:zeta toxin family protein [Parcubacteria group bacterium]
MNKEEQKNSDAAIEYVKKHSDEIIQKFASIKTFPLSEYPVSVFMAGSPGAGKTEFSQEVLDVWFGDSDIQDAVRIDPDEVRKIIPGYDGTNAYLFQAAVSVGVEKIHDSVLKYGQNFILDGTLSIFKKAKENIQRSIDKHRLVFIFYIYQDPLVAWAFTKEREVKEGRKIPKQAFIEQFFGARDSVNQIKEYFGDKIKVYLVEKNFENKIQKIMINITKIDSHISFGYNKETLTKALKNI